MNSSACRREFDKSGDPLGKRAIKRMEFADLWVKRFINVLDNTLDEETKKK